jgi:tRNA(Ile)-lysidine synthase
MKRRGSHPPTLLKRVERTLREECRLPAGSRLLLAVSGGPDSQALLSVMARLAPSLELELLAHGVDHGLRSEAAGELELAARLAARLGLPFASTRVEVERGGNLMARARAARYRALRVAAERAGASFLVTAHHADDRAETVLARLLRGSGPRGLAVLPARQGDLARPMIRARRTDVQAHLARHGVEFASDPTNVDPRFLRTRIRREVLPLLEALSPNVVEHLNALADQLVGPPPPRLEDAEGEAIPLGRAQIAQLRRLLESPRSRGTVALPGGRSVQLDPESGALVVRSRRDAPRGVKLRKSD